MKNYILILAFCFITLISYTQDKWDTIKVVMLVSDTTSFVEDGVKKLAAPGMVYTIFGYKLQHTEKSWRTVYLDIDKKKLNKTVMVWFYRRVNE